MNLPIGKLAKACVPALVAAAFTAHAQAPLAPDDAAKKPAMKKGAIMAPEKQEPLATRAKQDSQKGTQSKAPLNTQSKAPLNTQSKAPLNSPNPNVTVFRNGERPPILRDKDGNVIPTSPDAFDVSSATGKKK
jgi:hypothetical protein